MKLIYLPSELKKLANRMMFCLLFINLVALQIGAQTTYTFTNCNGTGRIGPSISQVTAAYVSTNLNGLVSTTSPTSGIQTFTIPTGVNSITIEAYGAQGGQVGSNAGGMGARMRGTFTVTPGQVLNIVVGQMGLTQTTTNCNGGGGGGGSFVYLNSAPQPMIAAGGGGGGHRYIGPGVDGTITTSAGTSSNVSGTAGTGGSGGGAGICGSGWPGAGGGGWSTAGGNTCLWSGLATFGGGTQFSWLGGLRNTNTTQGSQGQDGSFGGGGAAFHGAGGGGGYSGGGGGGSCSIGNLPLGGGGGSYNAGTNQSNSSGVKTGHGQVIISFNLNQALSVGIAETGSINCFGNSTGTLTAQPAGGTPPYSYTWMPGAGSSSVITNVPAGIYTVTVSDATLGVSSATYNLTQPPAISLTASQTSITPCYGGNNGSATVTASGGSPGFSYTWMPSGGTASVASGLTAGNYTIDVVDNNGCPMTTSVAVTEPAPAITASVSSNPVCNGGTVSLMGVGGTSYTWTGGVTNGVAFTPTVSASYTVSGTNSLTGCSNTAAISVSVGSTPTVSITGASTVCAGSSITLSASGAPSYSWNTGATTSTVSVSPTVNTVYTVTGSDFGCSGTATAEVTVVICTGLSTQLSVNSGILIYPNPTKGELNIELKNGLSKTIEVSDYTGKILFSEFSSKETVTVDLSAYAKGIYFVKIHSNNKIEVVKVIRQ